MPNALNGSRRMHNNNYHLQGAYELNFDYKLYYIIMY